MKYLVNYLCLSNCQYLRPEGMRYCSVFLAMVHKLAWKVGKEERGVGGQTKQCIFQGNVLLVGFRVCGYICMLQIIQIWRSRAHVYSAVLYTNRYFYSTTDYYCSRDIPNAIVTSFSCNLVIFKLRTSCPLFVHVFPTNAECVTQVVFLKLLLLLIMLTYQFFCDPL
ncbi:hypothetical protein PanWU01x14_304910 [Parasponia andersonii]|uniref:Uncharacterized protein n=1 Tax=Parasponia andersonii TaxID=3476 RepID=A0A2P5ASC4_PARAD|nr:hypothetical protein PanWU01x14_304910 [Parasponia andersonii]